MGGLALWALLWLAPETGLLLFWNLLIPVAPALIVVAAGVWRNVCPLATVALMARRMDWSRGVRLSARWQGRLQLAGLGLLLSVVPLRHVFFDRDGPATALLLTALGLLAFASGWLFEWKSGWCNGLCPVLPVEKLYGAQTIAPVRNARCTSCAGCTAVCPDSTAAMSPHTGAKQRLHQAAATLLVGGFPGFVAGWSLVPDSPAAPRADEVVQAFAMPLGGMALSLAVYAVLARTKPEGGAALRRWFAAAAVALYYWFRLPALIGFGAHPDDGVLVDLSGSVPLVVPWLLRTAAAVFFIWWLVQRRVPARPWSERPLRSGGRC
jgi:ferredoxin